MSTPTTLLRLEGADALAVLHRISTQFVNDLAPGRSRWTLFCEFRGRLLHRVAVARTADGALWLARDDAPGAELLAHLDKHVFREDVRMADRGDRFSVRTIDRGALEPGTVRERDGVPELIAPDEGTALAISPGKMAHPHADEDELARIAAGRPRHGHEIAIDF